ncbi:MAG: substrate-binding domain-containing protein [Paramuribaculum sp.]|nr:substrate-binding domain-containing protein [Paramuribaculum sp.]
MKKIIASLSALVFMASLFTACDKKPTSRASEGIATVVCDESFANILSQEIDVFEYIYPESNVIPYYVDEHAAFDSLFDMKTKLIVAMRMLTPKEIAYFTDRKKQVRQSCIAVDAIALIVNPANSIEQISTSELSEILTGKITEWDDIWPTKGLGKIEVVFDHQGSSTVDYMRDSLLNGAELGPNVFAQKNNDEVFKAVMANKNAIGVLGVSWISTDMATREMTREERVASLERNDTINNDFRPEVKVLKVSGPDQVQAYAPYQYYIYTGDYPLHRSIYMISTGAGGTLSHGFYTFVTSFRGQKIIQATGVLPHIIYTQRAELK